MTRSLWFRSSQHRASVRLTADQSLIQVALLRPCSLPSGTPGYGGLGIRRRELAFTSALGESLGKFTQLSHEDRRLLKGGEMAAFFGLIPID